MVHKFFEWESINWIHFKVFKSDKMYIQCGRHIQYCIKYTTLLEVVDNIIYSSISPNKEIYINHKLFEFLYIQEDRSLQVKSVICWCFVENVSNTLGNMLMCKLMNYRKDYLSSYNFFCFSQFIKKLSSAEFFLWKMVQSRILLKLWVCLLFRDHSYTMGGRIFLLSLLLWILIRSYLNGKIGDKKKRKVALYDRANYNLHNTLHPESVKLI